MAAHPPPVPDGIEVIDDDRGLQAAASDFGGTCQWRPRFVLRPRDLSGFQTAVAYARQLGAPWVVRGRGHSLAGQAQMDEGVVIDTSALRGAQIQDGRAIAEPGATWRQVLDAATREGLTPPVLTDYLDLSVAGTLSVGGIGGATHQHGFHTDNVDSLDVLTPQGDSVTCSRQQRTDLFDAARAGHGTTTISRAVLRLVPAHSQARRFKMYYQDPAALLAAQRKAITQQKFDYVEGQAVADEYGAWRYFLEGAVFHNGHAPELDSLAPDTTHTEAELENLSFRSFADRLRPAEALLRELGEWQRPHPWCNLFVPDSTVDEVFAALMSELTLPDIGEYGTLLIYPFFTRHCRTPRIALPDGEVVFLLALLRTARDLPDARRMLAANDRLRARVEAHGGTVYLPWRP